MKNISFIFLWLNIFSIAAMAQTTKTEPAATHKVYVQKSPNKIVVTTANSNQLLKEVEQGKAYLVDVRTPEEFNTGHLQFAQNINLRSADFGALVNKLNKSKPVYLYCHSGNRSGQATDSLVSLGYAQAYNIGALDTLKKRGFPVQ